LQRKDFEHLSRLDAARADRGRISSTYCLLLGRRRTAKTRVRIVEVELDNPALCPSHQIAALTATSTS